MTRRSILVVPLLTAALATTLGLGAVGTVGSIVGTVDVTGLSSHGGAIVYVQQVPGAFAPSAARMDQQKMEFVPHVLPVAIGTTVTFLNSDSTPHFVFTPDYEKFVLGAERPGEGKDRTFDKCVKFPCVYTVLCPMHAEMEGFVVVLQNPFFAVSDKDGRYTIEHVPEGKYSIGVWHPTLKGRAEPVTVTAGEPLTLDFKLTK